MRNTNVVIVEGHLVRDPKMTQSAKGNPVLKFSIATNGYGTVSQKSSSELVSFFDIIAWSELADSYSDKLKKGVGIRVIGSLSQWRWKDDSGKSRSKVSVMAQNIDLLRSNQKPKHF